MRSVEGSFRGRGWVCGTGNSFKGVFNHLEAAAEFGWSKIRGLEDVVPRYSGRPDLIVQEGARLLEVELKNLARGAKKLSSADYQQLNEKIKAAIQRAGGLENLDIDELGRQLANLQYRIRGIERVDYDALFRQDFYATAGDWLALELGERFRGLANNIDLLFQGKRLPF